MSSSSDDDVKSAADPVVVAAEQKIAAARGRNSKRPADSSSSNTSSSEDDSVIVLPIPPTPTFEPTPPDLQAHSWQTPGGGNLWYPPAAAAFDTSTLSTQHYQTQYPSQDLAATAFNLGPLPIQQQNFGQAGGPFSYSSSYTSAIAPAPATPVTVAGSKKKKSATKKKKSNKKKKNKPVLADEEESAEQEPAKKPRQKRPAKEKPLPPHVAAFTYDHHKWLIIGDEIDNSKRGKKQAARDDEAIEKGLVYKAAQYIEFWKGTDKYLKFDLKTLNCQQIRQVAANFGCMRCGSDSMFRCRVEMAKRVAMGDAYTNLNIPNTTASAHDKKVNTLMRLVNAVFHPNFITKFLELNDTKRRKELEQASGGSPLKLFWIDVSEFINDAMNNDTLSIILDSKEDEDEHLFGWVSEGILNLNEYNQGTHQTCAKHMRDMMKCRNLIRGSMSISGEHSNDPFTYLNRKHLTAGKKTILPGPPVYYLDKQCQKYNSIDASYATVLSDHLKSCSMGGGNGNEEEDDDTTLTTRSSTTTAAKQEEFLVEFKAAKAEMVKHQEQSNKNQERANEQRAALLQMQERSLQSKETATLWAEYITLTRTVTDLREAESMADPLIIKNVARRVRLVEAAVGIPDNDSIVQWVTKDD